MYLYFDNVGNLKEIINDIPARVGDSGINYVYVYWEAFSNDYTDLTIDYLLPNDNTIQQTLTINNTSKITKQIPYDKKRDLLFFEYGKDYQFIKFVIPDSALSMSGRVNMTITYINGSTTPVMSGVNFMTEGNTDYEPTEHLDIANYNNLLKLLGGKQNLLTVGNGIDITGDTISADYTNTTFTNLLKALLTPTMFSASIVYENELLFTYNGENKIGILTFGNTFTILPLYNLTSGTMYKTSGTFVYDENGSVKTTTINFSCDSENSKLRVWSGDRNYHFANGYTAYLFGITLY